MIQNPLDVALQECVNTITALQARVINLAIENDGLKAALEAAKSKAAPENQESPAALAT